MAKRGLWISFDLGVDGDYEGLYHWLDLHKAVECGGNVAFMQYKADMPVEPFLEDLVDKINLREKDKIYVIGWIGKEGKELKLEGKFIFGNRKPASWEGYAPKPGKEKADEG